VLLIIAILVRPAITLAYVLSFRRTIADVLKSADEVEIGPRGVKWRRVSTRSSEYDSDPRFSRGPQVAQLALLGRPDMKPGWSRSSDRHCRDMPPV